MQEKVVNMHSLHSSYIFSFSLACCLVPLAAAFLVLLIARQYPALKAIGHALLAFVSTTVVALPGFVLLGLVVESINPLPLQPYLYAIGASSSCVLFNACLRGE
jgi:hypothetical protein